MMRMGRHQPVVVAKTLTPPGASAGRARWAGERGITSAEAARARLLALAEAERER